MLKILINLLQSLISNKTFISIFKKLKTFYFIWLKIIFMFPFMLYKNSTLVLFHIFVLALALKGPVINYFTLITLWIHLEAFSTIISLFLLSLSDIGYKFLTQSVGLEEQLLSVNFLMRSIGKVFGIGAGSIVLTHGDKYINYKVNASGIDAYSTACKTKGLTPDMEVVNNIMQSPSILDSLSAKINARFNISEDHQISLEAQKLSSSNINSDNFSSSNISSPFEYSFFDYLNYDYVIDIFSSILS